MKLKLLFLLFITSFLSSYADEVIICPPISGGSVVLYNEEAIDKGKYDKKHISLDPASPFNAPVIIGDVIPKGKDLIQILYVNGKKVAMYFPKTLKDKNINLGVKPFAKYDKDVAFGGGYTDPKREGYPIFSWYPYKEYANLEALKDSILYFTGGDDNIRRMGYRYGYQYKIRNLDFSNGNYTYDWHRFKCLRLSLNAQYRHSSGDSPREITFRPNGWEPHTKWDKDAISISHALDLFVPESQFMDSCRSVYSQESIDAFSQKYMGKEVYISALLPMFESEKYLPQYKHWTVDSLLFIRTTNAQPTPNFAYYAALTSSENPNIKYKVLIPHKNLTGIELSKDKRQRDEDARLAEEQHRYQIQQAEEQEERDQENAYAKKYGRANAKLIMNGEVKLGWTKEMCRESWGDPRDSTRVTTQFGSSEAWWYGSGYVLYFQGNKLVMIQD